MDYYKILNLEKEPFSNSPDPDLFFESKQHLECLQKIEIAVRLKRGLNLVIGEIGAGKTTICRKLIHRLSKDHSFECHLILDPGFTSELSFAKEIAQAFGGKPDPSLTNGRDIKETIKQLLFKKGVDQNKTLVLIIDEGQKLPIPCLEVLRELLNFETNQSKLLQIVIFAQQEFQDSLIKLPNFTDRLNLQHFLGPMSFKDTRDMIGYRIKKSCEAAVPPVLFSRAALYRIHGYAKGRPRKIINICHQCMLAMIIQNRTRIGWRLSGSCIKRSMPTIKSTPYAFSKSAFLMAVSLAFAAFFVFNSDLISDRFFWRSAPKDSGTSQAESISIPIIEAPSPPVQPDDVQANLPEIKPNKNAPLKDHTLFHPPSTVSNQEKQPEKQLTDKIETTDIAVAKQVEPEVPGPLESTPDKLIFNNMPPPDIIGSLVVNKNDTLGAMIKNVYGVYQSVFIDSVLQANPWIKNPDTVEKGAVIRFPSMGKNYRPVGGNYQWIAVDKAVNLQQAIHKLNKMSPVTPPLRIVVSWRPEKEIQYWIFIRGYFLTNGSARNFLGRLPSHLSDKATIISTWPKNCVVFSDLFIGGIL